MNLKGQGIVVAKRGVKLLHKVDASLQQGELVAVLGPNGAGKTTLLRALIGLQAVSDGQIHLEDQPISQFNDQTRALRVSYLPQQRELVWPNEVQDVVALGRYAHGAYLGSFSTRDEAAIEGAIDSCALQELRHRRLDTLSGGELARVHCARIFASQSPLIVADEPTAGLDLYHQHRLMALYRDAVDQGRGVLLVLHDLNLALTYADRIIWLNDGVIAGEHLPHEVTSQFVASLFSVKASVVQSNDHAYMLIAGYEDGST
ncbi:MAG: ABC transporter ATP-binding protein [Pseudomonadaceae bacterium]|nr:ABC transporter ATP-binding protein [Pseudomonadaceae bacterium]